MCLAFCLLNAVLFNTWTLFHIIVKSYFITSAPLLCPLLSLQISFIIFLTLFYRPTNKVNITVFPPKTIAEVWNLTHTRILLKFTLVPCEVKNHATHPKHYWTSCKLFFKHLYLLVMGLQICPFIYRFRL